MPRTTILSDPYVNVIGVDTETQFAVKLVEAGCGTTGPDSSGEYSSTCPAHADNVASLRWRVSIDGRILLDCHAGCEYKDILKAADVAAYELSPARVEYEYTNADGEYVFTVVRTFGADGKKGFKQGVRGADGMWTNNVAGVDTDILWRLDEIAAAERGPIHTLWLCEGEKDAAVVALGLGAAGREGEYASTFPGGAKRETDNALIEAVGRYGIRTLIVVVDRDKSGAGQKRGRRVARAMADGCPDVAVRILIPVEGAGKDVAELVDRFGSNGWEPRLEAMAYDSAEDALLDYGATFAAGSIVVMRPEVGRAVTCMVKPGKEEAPIAVLTGVVEPDAVHTSAAVGRRYAITITPQIHVADPIQTTITSNDLSSSQAFLRWLSRVPDFGRAPMSGVNVGDVADGLRMYLDYRVRIAGKPILVSPEACGWVDAETGVVADRASSRAALAFVDRDGRVVTATEDKVGVFAEPETRHGGVYGFELSETEAAWAFWQALTFADPDVTAPVAGFVGATVLSPFTAAAGAGLRPGLTVVAPSGSGKTHGATALLLGLAGCGGHQSGSAAGMRRKLEAGVGTMLWFDDTAAVEETRMKEWMRVAITRSEFTLSDTDAGTNAVHGGGLTSVPVVSSEGIGWLAETAMRDRFIAVHPTNPQGRTSMWPGKEKDAQWADLQAVEVGLLGGRPQRAAGRVVAGLTKEMRRRGRGSVWEGVREALAGASEGGVRREWARACAEVGLEAVIGWLEGVRAEAMAKGEWPGAEAGDWANELGWLRAGWRTWAALNVDDTASASCSLVDEVVPRLLQSHYDQAKTHKGYSETAIVGVSMGDKKEAAVGVKSAVSIGSGSSGIQRGLPPLIVDIDSYVWVRTSACASEYRKLVRSAEERTTGAAALAGQAGSPAVCDDPPWATFIKGNRVQSGVRVRIDGMGEAVYRRLSRVASDRAMSAARW